MKNKLSLLPNQPGCYLMKNKDNNIIYVGKAKDLKKRVVSYFRGTHIGKTKKLVSEIVDFDFIVVNTEMEALILENNLIKQYDPKYNILLRDDKSYPYIEFNIKKDPILSVVRNINRKSKSNYLYGPFPNVTAARTIVNLLNRIYPLRKCKTYNKKPCLYYHINQCLGYCSFDIDINKKNLMIEQIIEFLKGNHKFITEKIKEDMLKESSNLQFEKAKELKELLDYVEVILEKQQVEMNDFIDKDIFGYHYDKGYLCIQVLFIRGSKIIGKHHKIFPTVDLEKEEVIKYISRFYDKDIIMPKEIIIPFESDLLDEYLPAKVYSPQKGNKKKVLDIASDNAKILLEQNLELVKRDEVKTTEANEMLKNILNLNELKRIEIFDNSNLFGNYNVSGMVVFIDGREAKNEYRKYKITLDKNDDYGTMREVIYRRYFRVLRDNLVRPDLIIVDGGVGQINVAREVLKQLNMDILVIGLKKNDKHLTEKLLAFEPIIEIDIDKKTPLFHYLERMQDEVHNYTISFHKKLRSKGSLESILDNVSGIGEVRKIALLKKYKTLNKLKELTIEQLEELIPREVAINLIEHLKNI